MHENVSRREALKVGAGAALAAALAPGGARRALARPAPRPGPLRIAHLTDTHIQPERKATEGVAACLRHAMALDRRPDLVITGGDLVMDAFEQTRERTRTQWDLFTGTMRDGCGAELRHCLGNHDIWGWN